MKSTCNRKISKLGSFLERVICFFKLYIGKISVDYDSMTSLNLNFKVCKFIKVSVEIQITTKAFKRSLMFFLNSL